MIIWYSINYFDKHKTNVVQVRHHHSRHQQQLLITQKETHALQACLKYQRVSKSSSFYNIDEWTKNKKIKVDWTHWGRSPAQHEYTWREQQYPTLYSSRANEEIKTFHYH